MPAWVRPGQVAPSWQQGALGVLMPPCPCTPLLWGDVMPGRSPLGLPRLLGVVAMGR